MNWTESLQELSDKDFACLFISYRNATQSLHRCIINKRPGYGATTLGCRPCVEGCLLSLRDMDYRNHMHFYCFQLGFKGSLSKKRYKITIDKRRTDEVLPESATSGIYHDFLSALKDSQRNRSSHEAWTVREIVSIWNHRKDIRIVLIIFK